MMSDIPPKNKNSPTNDGSHENPPLLDMSQLTSGLIVSIQSFLDPFSFYCWMLVYRNEEDFIKSWLAEHTKKSLNLSIEKVIESGGTMGYNYFKGMMMDSNNLPYWLDNSERPDQRTIQKQTKGLIEPGDNLYIREYARRNNPYQPPPCTCSTKTMCYKRHFSPVPEWLGFQFLAELSAVHVLLVDIIGTTSAYMEHTRQGSMMLGHLFEAFASHFLCVVYPPHDASFYMVPDVHSNTNPRAMTILDMLTRNFNDSGNTWQIGRNNETSEIFKWATNSQQVGKFFVRFGPAGDPHKYASYPYLTWQWTYPFVDHTHFYDHSSNDTNFDDDDQEIDQYMYLVLRGSTEPADSSEVLEFWPKLKTAILQGLNYDMEYISNYENVHDIVREGNQTGIDCTGDEDDDNDNSAMELHADHDQETTTAVADAVMEEMISVQKQLEDEEEAIDVSQEEKDEFTQTVRSKLEMWRSYFEEIPMWESIGLVNRCQLRFDPAHFDMYCSELAKDFKHAQNGKHFSRSSIDTLQFGLEDLLMGISWTVQGEDGNRAAVLMGPHGSLWILPCFIGFAQEDSDEEGAEDDDEYMADDA